MLSELLNERIQVYYSVKFDMCNALKKWMPILDEVKKDISMSSFFDRRYVMEELVDFLERYKQVESITPKYTNMFTFGHSVEPKYPEEYIELPVALGLIIDDLLLYAVKDSKTKQKIQEEYFNILTGKKGILLKNGVRIEDGQVIDPEIVEQINNNISSIVKKRVDYILDPKKRKILDRNKKLKRILQY